MAVGVMLGRDGPPGASLGSGDITSQPGEESIPGRFSVTRDARPQVSSLPWGPRRDQQCFYVNCYLKHEPQGCFLKYSFK